MRVPVVLLMLVASVATSCSGGGCDASPLSVVPESAAAAIRATSCAPLVEVEGTTYMQWGCPSVRHALLGPVEARSERYVARSIEGVPEGTALAIRELHGVDEGRRCQGWLFWADVDLIDRDRPAVNNLAREVNTTGGLD